MTKLQNPAEDPIWLYNAYRGALNEDAISAAEVLKKTDLYQSLYNPNKPENFGIFDEDWIKFVPHSENVNSNNAMESLLLSFYREGVALAHIFDNNEAIRAKMSENEIAEIDRLGVRIDNSWELDPIISSRIHANSKFDQIAGRIHAVEALEYIRHQSVLVFARDTGMINQEKFEQNLAKLTQEMDSKGFNGIHKMLEANPSIKENFASDIRFMMPESELHRQIEGTIGVDDIFPSDRIERGEYYRKMSEHIADDPKKEKLLIEMMAGNDYREAYNNHNIKIKRYSERAQNDIVLNQNINELIESVQSFENDISIKQEAYRALMINYGLGSQHEIIKMCEDTFANNDFSQDTKLLTGHKQDDAQKKNWFEWICKWIGERIQEQWRTGNSDSSTRER